MSPSTKSLRILHLISSERWTGAAEPVASLALGQNALGHDARLACVPGRSLMRIARTRGLTVLDDMHLNRRLHPLHTLSDLRFLPRWCREQGVDVVHAHLLHDHWTAALSLRGLRRSTARPALVRTIHGSDPVRNDGLHRRLFTQWTDRIVCVSDAAARAAEDTLGLSDGAVARIGGGVDLERFHPGAEAASLREELDIPSEAPVAGIVARMREGRGLHWLMRAVPRVLERVPDAHFIAVGRGELKKWFREEIRKPEYRGQVVYAGYRRDAELVRAYAAMDVSLFLGLGSEGTCRAVLEAMACARPTIGASVGAVPETVADGETGLLVRHRDVDALADALARALGDRRRCREMGAAARRRAEDIFSEARRTEAVCELYREIL